MSKVTPLFYFINSMRTISAITKKKIGRNLWLFFFGKCNGPSRLSPTYVSLKDTKNILIYNVGYLKTFLLGRRGMNNQRKSNSVSYNTPHWNIIALISCAHRSPKVTLITVFVSIVAWKQARWPPLFITFLISPCLVTTTYQVLPEIYGGFFY